jgi:pyruvate dehydrogenase E2 component (dihydrolipoamide acetyltransferase)
MSMQQIGVRLENLAGKRPDKKLQPKEMEGSTFTISNLEGVQDYRILLSNQPNSAIMW